LDHGEEEEEEEDLVITLIRGPASRRRGLDRSDVCGGERPGKNKRPAMPAFFSFISAFCFVFAARRTDLTKRQA
jgi:hypothetical protein